jgi:hypothetical protein
MRLKLVIVISLLSSCVFAGAVMTKSNAVKHTEEFVLFTTTKKELLDSTGASPPGIFRHTTLKGFGNREVLVIWGNPYSGVESAQIYMYAKVEGGWHFFMLRWAYGETVSSVALDKSRTNIIVKSLKNRVLVIQPMNSIG